MRSEPSRYSETWASGRGFILINTSAVYNAELGQAIDSRDAGEDRTNSVGCQRLPKSHGEESVVANDSITAK